MYAAQFGLRDNPFTITPDPGYLYLSPRHQEALAHLLYGTGEDGGFVALTGEVGTGKTTLIRALLDQRLDNVDVALCLNPRLTVQELLAVILDELQADYPRDGHTLKPLLDALNAHLLQTHAQGRRTVLIIDEAQNLDREVLEQVRLLTNLETRRHKLLRIILVGQPELTRLLERRDLRQLAQRITARYHLLPLDAGQTRAYVEHRLHVAGARQDLFTPSALRAIHRLSRGVPRLINIICDRALLGAYASRSHQVSAAIVHRAAREALNLHRDRRPLAGLAAALAATLAVLLIYPLWQSAPPMPALVATTESPPAIPPPEPAATTAPPPAPLPAPEPEPAASVPVTETTPAPLSPATASADPLTTLLAAPAMDAPLARLLAAWGEDTRLPLDKAPCQALDERGLNCLSGQVEPGPGWRELRRYNRPALLTLTTADGTHRPVLLRALDGDTAVLETPAGTMRLPVPQLDGVWSGEYLLLWRPQTDTTLINSATQGQAIAWLHRRLALAEGVESIGPLPTTFDAGLRERIQRFQRSHGLEPDGLVGPRTMPLLNNLAPAPGTPLLAPLSHSPGE